MALVANEGFQHILRVLNTNVDGRTKIMYALTSIRGIGRRFANIVCKKADVDLNKRYAPLSLSSLSSHSSLSMAPSLPPFFTLYRIPPFTTSHHPHSPRPITRVLVRAVSPAICCSSRFLSSSCPMRRLSFLA
ncbi:unnamed protein product [Closterium sp. NIES-64]|nr:unnamed protein product [Closterium sp. NIES-64]